MAWFILLIAGLLEVVWAIGLRYTEGFTKLWPSIGTGAAIVVSLWLLSVAVRTLPVGVAYAVWVGIGAVGTFVLGVIVLDEPVSTMRVAGITLIIGGIVLLRLA